MTSKSVVERFKALTKEKQDSAPDEIRFAVTQLSSGFGTFPMIKKVSEWLDSEDVNTGADTDVNTGSDTNVNTDADTDEGVSGTGEDEAEDDKEVTVEDEDDKSDPV